MKRHYFLILLLLILMCLGQGAFAAEISEIRILDGSGRTELTETTTYLTRENLVDFQVDYLGASSIKIGALTKSVTESVYDEATVTFRDYVLKPGLNKLTVQAVGSGGTAKKNITINYVSSFVNETQYVLEIPSTGKISIFDKAVNLTLPKDDFIVDSGGDIIEDQKIKFEVTDLDTDDYPSKFRTPVSNVIDISANDSDGKRLINPGTISIKYSAEVPESSASNITIMYTQGSDWVNIGAVVDAKNRTATAPFQEFGEYAVFNASRFFDDYNWAKPYAEPLWAKGIMQIRQSDGDIVSEDFDEDTQELGLENDCLRADFASMIVKALGLLPVNKPGSDNSRFTDISTSDDEQDIETAAAYGIVEGVSVNRFNPNGSLTRAQAAVIVARVLNLSLTIDETKVATELQKVFTDEDDFNAIPDWARPHVLACVKGKYFNGIPTGDGSEVEFKANQKLNRGEAAKLVYLIMKAKKRI